MTAKEYQFCETKGKCLTFLNPITIVQTVKARRRLSVQNILNAIIVAKECIIGRSNSWVIHADFRKNPIAKITPLTKRKPSIKTVKLMAEGYKDSADDDLALAKEFEGIEPIIDDECY